MSRLGEELLSFHDEIIERWASRWSEVAPHPELSHAALRDSLPLQLEVIGQQLLDLQKAAPAEELWHEVERLDPEARVDQGVPIEEIVLEYSLLVSVVRDLFEERDTPVSFAESSYFFRAVFELVAESVRRYAAHQAGTVTWERSTYLAGVAHQMRSPLTALRVNVDMLKSGRAEATPALVAALERSVRTLTRMVQATGRTERFATSERAVVPEVVQPARLIDEVLEDLEHEARAKSLRLEVAVNRTLEMSIDPNPFVDALSNLVHNAIKYTETGFVRVEVGEREDVVEFCVRDSGAGIPAAKQSALFRPQTSTTGGLGLGLSIVKKAVEAQGGTVAVWSKPGEGSRFCFSLPMRVQRRAVEEREG